MTDKLQVGIVGLGLVGVSAGLALHRYQEKVSVTGHDPRPEAASLAKRMGAVDRTEWNLISAVMNADRVILALPVSELYDTLKAIGPELKAGCVVVDTAEVKGPVMKWAAELLPKEVHFVGGHPILMAERLDPEGASADLFERKLFCLTPDSGTDDTAVRLAADVVEALGGQPFFLDPLEHDGLAAAVEYLPMITAGALMSVTTGSSGWSDMRKVAGNQYFASTLIAGTSSKSAAAGAVANREQVVYWLDTMIKELETWRDRVAASDTQALTEGLDAGLSAGQRWLAAQMSGNWQEEETPSELPTSGSMFRDLFWGRRRPAVERVKRR
jgi:prephenate dehydrogenase